VARRTCNPSTKKTAAAIAINLAIFLCGALPHASHAQGADAIKGILLGSAGFSVDGDCGRTGGKSELKFTEAGGKMTVDILNVYNNSRCTRDVALTDTGFKFDGCRDTGIVMTYNAADKALPFTGKGASCTYKATPK
jgi:hypothetical protein